MSTELRFTSECQDADAPSLEDRLAAAEQALRDIEGYSRMPIGDVRAPDMEFAEMCLDAAKRCSDRARAYLEGGK